MSQIKFELEVIKVLQDKVFNVDSYNGPGLYLVNDSKMFHLAYVQSNNILSCIPLESKDIIDQLAKQYSDKIQQGKEKSEQDFKSEILRCLDYISSNIQGSAQTNVSTLDPNDMLKAIAVSQKPDLIKDL